MRILMYAAGKPFTEPQTGGNKRFAELAAYLCREYNADICCGDDDETLGALKRHVKFRFDSGNKTRASLLPPEARRMLANRSLIRKIQREGYDRVVTFDVPPTIGLCLNGVDNIVMMVRKDLIGYDRTLHPSNSLKNRIRRAFLRMCEGICLKRARRVIVQCEYDKAELLKRQPRADAKKIKIQINNVNPSWIVDKSREAAPTAEKLERFRIGFVGNFKDRRKGHDLLLNVARKITEERQDVGFDIIGGGGDYEKYRRTYESGQIRFYGMVSNPIRILKRCDLAVVPSMADSCPNTVMEALYNGIPVIGSDRGGIPEILGHHPEAMFELDDIGLYDALNGYIHDAEALEALNSFEKRRKDELTFNWSERMARWILES